ncbi:DUF1294 domain-containing protein [Amphritea japonica]|uniref:DUF1294 domain-containing protein n=1 Tax=Amphritea japonica ATCC BAA-1530 TaxID=1278309 RepID=A0A7R6ST50_9GAMM|nr:DUF1294 domain-containing protein [Amphritea japonica]BBB26252.1 hypothetical protein AMJAP_1657 [Amphritea japonica ATCC BAA-1530]
MDNELSSLLGSTGAELISVLFTWGALWLLLRLLSSAVMATWLANAFLLTAIAATLIASLGFKLNLYAELNGWGLLTVLMVGLNLVVVPLFYWLDKRKSCRQSATRIPEAVLHSLAFSGGAASALVSQQFFNHKTVKPGFRLKTWAALILNMILFYALSTVFI